MTTERRDRIAYIILVATMASQNDQSLFGFLGIGERSQYPEKWVMEMLSKNNISKDELREFYRLAAAEVAAARVNL